MKILGIIAEYNPFHNGHKYHIQKAKEITGCELVIVVMSGSFTQSGNIAIYDKFTRAKLACDNGVDMVIELPTIYSNSSAGYFAKGAVSILNDLNIVDCMCFGSEIDNIDTLSKISRILNENSKLIWDKISINSKDGNSFAKSRMLALSSFLTDEQIDIISKPNNILGLEYLNMLDSLNSVITPHLIKRNSSNFNETNLEDSLFTSATSIRNAIYENKEMSTIQKYVPNNVAEIILNKKATFTEELFHIIKYKILTTSLIDLQNIVNVSEGIENKIISAIGESKNYDDFIHNIKSKRYQMSKIKRLLVNVVINISKDDLNTANRSGINYAHVLAVSKDGKQLLSTLNKNSNLQILTSINDNIISTLETNDKKFLSLDILATNIHSSLNNLPMNLDYTNKL